MIRFGDLLLEDAGLVLQWRNRPDLAENMYTNREITAVKHQVWFGEILNAAPQTVAWDDRRIGVDNTAQTNPKDGWVYLGWYERFNELWQQRIGKTWP